MAQWMEDFSDGDFTVNPTWAGDVDRYEVNADLELQLQAPEEEAESYLSTPSDIIDDATWEFRLEMDFNPSGSNRTFVYLVSDQSDLAAPLNGYYVLLGNTADEVSLYRQDGDNSTLLIDGQDDLLDISSVDITVQVTRTSSGMWTLFTDLDNSGTFVQEGTAQDETHEVAGHFGWRADYTSSRSDAFFLDDISVSGSALIDDEAPILQSIMVLSADQLELSFNEALDATTVETLSNYMWSGQSPSSALSSGSAVELQFLVEFPLNDEQQLEVSGIEDLAGNVMAPTSIPFSYSLVGEGVEGAVVINEIYADQTPSIGLPVTEYLEIFNASDSAYQLADWTLVNTEVVDPLGEVILNPGAHLILCDASDIGLFDPLLPVLGVDGLTALTNGGDSLTLRNGQDEVIDIVVYDISWYGGGDFDDGGYSLERINPFLPCSSELNWTVSSSLIGGTPGAQNSVFVGTDVVSPTVLSLEVLDETTLLLSFDEAMDELSLILGLYELSPGPEVFTALPEGLNAVTLFLDGPLVAGEAYSLSVDDLSDCTGNPLAPVSFEFFVPEEPEIGDVLINEIMADPTPTNGLPDLEYIELYNRSDKVLSLKDWTLVNSETEKPLSDSLLLSGEYVILCDIEDITTFQPFGKVIGIDGFVSISNLGDSLSLLDEQGRIMDIVAFTTEWYNDDARDGGGYSLERVNPTLDCTGSENWRASLADARGTPGIINSVFSDDPDILAPELVYCFAEGPTVIRIRMDEGYDIASLDSAIFFINDSIEVLSSLPLNRTDFRIILSQALLEQQVYTLQIEGVQDCAGNTMQLTECPIGATSLAEIGDIVINEILFNPRTGGVDFVELYNRSPRAIDLRLWALTEDLNDPERETTELTTELFVLLPGEYLVLTENPDNLILEYPLGRPRRYLEVDNLIPMPDDEGTVVLQDPLLQTQDEFYYSEDYHFALIDDLDGVSLERVDPERMTDDPTNWHSAAERVGWATPGYENSQLSPANPSDMGFQIEPKVFSPDNDGFQDLLQISYSMDQPGQVANVSIYDRDGRFIRELVRNELLATEGVLTWDGLDDNRAKARIGVYIILIELFDLEGNVSSTKKTCVLAGRF